MDANVQAKITENHTMFSSISYYSKGYGLGHSYSNTGIVSHGPRRVTGLQKLKLLKIPSHIAQSHY